MVINLLQDFMSTSFFFSSISGALGSPKMLRCMKSRTSKDALLSWKGKCAVNGLDLHGLFFLFFQMGWIILKPYLCWGQPVTDWFLHWSQTLISPIISAEIQIKFLSSISLCHTNKTVGVCLQVASFTAPVPYLKIWLPFWRQKNVTLHRLKSWMTPRS